MPSSFAREPPTCASISRSEPESGVKQYRPFLELTKLAFQLSLRRWQLFAAAILTAFAVQVALSLVFRVPHGLELGSAIAVPLVVALVYAFVSADAGESAVAESLIWERFLERAWAVIILDFLLSYLTEPIFAPEASTNMFVLFLGLGAIILCTFTVFADTAAVIDDDVTVWTVIPRSLVRSIAVTWNRVVFMRAMALFMIQLVVFDAQRLLYEGLLQLHIAQAPFWAFVPIAVLIAVPIAALTVVVYRDAAGVLR